MQGVNKSKGVVVLSAALAALLFLPAEAVLAHARWTTNSTVLVPRSTSDGLKTGPCGNIPRTNTTKTFAPGQTIEVEWEETINHPGSYRIAFSPADDLGFDNNVLYSANDLLGTETPLPHKYTATITLPAQTCEACTLQLIQVMTDRTPPTNYYSCADIRIATDTGGGGSGGGIPPVEIPEDIEDFAQQLLEDFSAADSDNDKALSFSEIQAVYPALTSEQFNALDVTKDGLLSTADLNAVIAPPKTDNTAPPSSGSSSSGTGTGTKQDEKAASAGSFDWTLLLLFAGYLLLLRDRRRKARLHGHLPHYYDLLPPRRR
jgi:hypothetical protein